jgi:glucans biosynthesis protein
MFLLDATNRGRFDDFRPAVHDSDGLLMLTGRGEWLWRPLANPRLLQVSAFVDQAPLGFGLMQRKRAYDDFEDLEARYERRPSVWVEPVGDWGAGSVELVEIPTDREINDNIVAYWRPERVLAAGTAYDMTYRLYWCEGWPLPGTGTLAQVHATAAGLNFNHDKRLFVIDFTGGDLSGAVTAKAEANAGELANVNSHPNPETGGTRLSFELDPKGAEVVELRAQLVRDGAPVSETWLYRWTT